jgi:hypothetical protein
MGMTYELISHTIARLSLQYNNTIDINISYSIAISDSY